ncbi:hypothetical protein G6N74_08980 [Mesorhizobium sp. CGMCC 1.15528]|uniref:DUF1849 family protein n=1 Tax=Mesorhizobium zhangyense TaxID=1776730 RepID=A0A7C9R6Q7_9HYPH|nr:hypothetical protein [Mesorhizobium zhangyense]NGN41196.1 hypothetical protein [Mesorhizobium zhangyense]
MALRRFVLAASFIGGVMSSYAAQQECKGDTNQEHHLGNFNFVTSSWVENIDGRRRYVSCVANLDVGSDLLVHWFIPGPYKEYVPSSRVITRIRLRDDLNTRPVSGCLQYGGLGELTTADFLGTTDDEERNKKGDCKNQAAEVRDVGTAIGGLPPSGYADEVQVYFPSDPSNPYDTMLELTGKIGFSVDGSMYSSFFQYSVQQLQGREKGVVEEIRVEPYFPVAADKFVAAYTKANANTYALSKEGLINFKFFGESNNSWRTVEAYYQFIDKENHVVARIPMPLMLYEGQ